MRFATLGQNKEGNSTETVSPPWCFFLAVRVRITPCLRPSASLRLGQGHRLEGGRKESHRHFSPSVSARPYLRSAVPAPVSRPSNEPSVRPSASVRCSCLRTGGERVECRKDVRSPESRPTASLPAERVLQRRTAASGPAKRRPADLHAKAFP